MASFSGPDLKAKALKEMCDHWERIVKFVDETFKAANMVLNHGGAVNLIDSLQESTQLLKICRERFAKVNRCLLTEPLPNQSLKIGISKPLETVKCLIPIAKSNEPYKVQITDGDLRKPTWYLLKVCACNNALLKLEEELRDCYQSHTNQEKLRIRFPAIGSQYSASCYGGLRPDNCNFPSPFIPNRTPLLRHNRWAPEETPLIPKTSTKKRDVSALLDFKLPSAIKDGSLFTLDMTPSSPLSSIVSAEVKKDSFIGVKSASIPLNLLTATPNTPIGFLRMPSTIRKTPLISAAISVRKVTPTALIETGQEATRSVFSIQAKAGAIEAVNLAYAPSTISTGALKTTMAHAASSTSARAIRTLKKNSTDAVWQVFCYHQASKLDHSFLPPQNEFDNQLKMLFKQSCRNRLFETIDGSCKSPSSSKTSVKGKIQRISTRFGRSGSKRFLRNELSFAHRINPTRTNRRGGSESGLSHQPLGSSAA